MKSQHLFFILIFFMSCAFFSCEKDNFDDPEDILLSDIIETLIFSSEKPNVYQIEQIERKYGMFIHFGINTFHNAEWTNGRKPATTYNPTGINARQWVETAKNAKMKYIVLVSKHHDGFCLDRKSVV